MSYPTDPATLIVFWSIVLYFINKFFTNTYIIKYIKTIKEKMNNFDLLWPNMI